MREPRYLNSSCRSGRALVWLAALTLLLAAPAALEAKKKGPKPEDLLPEQYRAWLEDVQFIISKEERKLFLELEKDYQRDAFIERFWKVRDPYPGSTRNEFRDEYEERLRAVRSMAYSISASIEFSVPSTICRTIGSTFSADSRMAPSSSARSSAMLVIGFAPPGCLLAVRSGCRARRP